jgi:hypothetical protein
MFFVVNPRFFCVHTVAQSLSFVIFSFRTPKLLTACFFACRENVNLDNYDEEPRITQIRADGPFTSFVFIRAYSRNPRLDFILVEVAGRAGSFVVKSRFIFLLPIFLSSDDSMGHSSGTC